MEAYQEKKVGQLKSGVKHLIFSKAYQLYFCIFANDLLRYTGYSKFTRELCPSKSISSIRTLNIDAHSLYQILNKKLNGYQDNVSTELIIYGYNNEPISSVEIACRNKDAVFNSVFDLTKVQETCEAYGLKSGHQITILPDAKAVRSLGVKKKGRAYI
ncbi:hypothetical protein EDC94DRAFT_579802 [Helicostylum pulchrum]|nr:hypothetical protein EDC94DRAFT_579802 [Helicostylum pulchrum]